MQHVSIIFFFIVIAGGIFEGCSTKKEYTADKSFVRTYAELAILYEKEKIADKVSDSTYQSTVNNFFLSHTLTKQEFDGRVASILQDGTRWCQFLANVSTDMTDIKRGKN